MQNAQVSAPSVLQGAPPLFINSNFDVGALRPYVAKDGQSYVALSGKPRPVTNALLKKDEWEELDRVIVDVASTVLNGIADLRARPRLRRTLGGLGTIIAQYNQLADMKEASATMSPSERGDFDSASFNLVGVPVPIVHKSFEIDIRTLSASRRMGDGLDTTNAAVATRKVGEKLEDILFNGLGIQVLGGTAYGYTTLPGRATGSLSAAWTGAGADPVADVLAMIALARASNYRGPYGLYVPDGYSVVLEDDYKAESDKTVAERLTDISGIEFVKPSGQLADDNVVLVQLTPDVVQIAIAQDIVPVEWSLMGGLVERTRVMTAMVPIVKSDAAGNSGVVHFTVA